MANNKYAIPNIFAIGTTILAIKMMAAMPHISLSTKEITPDMIVSSWSNPLVITMEIGTKLAGNRAMVAAIKYAQVFWMDFGLR